MVCYLFLSLLTCVLVFSVISDSCDPIDCSLPAPLSMGLFLERTLEWVAFSFSGDLLNSGIKPLSLASPALAGRFFYP